MNRGLAAFGLLVFAGTALAIDLVGLEPPVPIAAAGRPVDVQREGHAAPFLGDFDGDGVSDLLVGEFHEGRLRVYLNHGSATKPSFGEYFWFKIGVELGRVPTG